MKFALLIALLSVGCASSSGIESNHRAPAGFAGIAAVAPGSSVLYQGPFEHGAEPARRPAKVYLPVQYETQETWPLVVLLHGFSGTAEQEDAYLGLRFRVSQRGYVLLTPNGTLTPAGTKSSKGEDLSGNPFWAATDACCDFGRTNVDDAGYLTRLIAEIKSKYKIDPRQVYIFGHSNGGFMANRLACEMGSEVSAIAVLAGGAYKDASKCKGATATRYLQVHALDDQTILFDGTPEYAGAREAVSQWRGRNGCSAANKTAQPEDFVVLVPKSDTTPVAWTQCTSGRTVELWTIRAHQQKFHSAHIPLFHTRFTDRVLDFLFQQ